MKMSKNDSNIDIPTFSSNKEIRIRIWGLKPRFVHHTPRVYFLVDLAFSGRIYGGFLSLEFMYRMEHNFG